MQMLKRFSFSLLIVALILSFYAVPEVAAEGSDHVTMSKGDGFALYNGAKLPSLPEYDTEAYPYAVLWVNNSSMWFFRAFSKPLFNDGSSILSNYEEMSAVQYRMGPTESEWTFLIEGVLPNGFSLGAGVFTLKWSNYDIINTTDNSVYFTGSDPIPLDGMNVIEWDGDTTGLVAFEGVANCYKVSGNTDVDTSKGIVGVRYICGNSSYSTSRVSMTKNDIAASNVWQSSAAGVFYVASAGDDYSTTGLFFSSVANRAFTCLFAYYPIEETTVDYTFTYTTEHGTAPGNKTVTVNVGESYTLIDVDLPTLSADGYVFKGWTANGVPVFAGNTIDGDIHLVASWELEPVPDPPEDPDPPQPPPDEEPDGNGIEAVKALIDAVVGVMQIEFTLWGFTFTFWQMMLFGIFVYIASWFIGGFFND